MIICFIMYCFNAKYSRLVAINPLLYNIDGWLIDNMYMFISLFYTIAIYLWYLLRQSFIFLLCSCCVSLGDEHQLTVPIRFSRIIFFPINNHQIDFITSTPQTTIHYYSLEPLSKLYQCLELISILFW